MYPLKVCLTSKLFEYTNLCHSTNKNHKFIKRPILMNSQKFVAHIKMLYYGITCNFHEIKIIA